MTAVRIRLTICSIVALISIQSSGAIFTRHDRILNVVRGKAMDACGKLLAAPLSTKNWSRPKTLKNGERAIRGAVDMAESWVAALVANDRTALDHLVAFSYEYSKADISQESYDLFTKLNMIDSAGFKLADYPATVRSIVRKTEGGGVAYFTSPLPLPKLPDWKLRRYLDQIDEHVVRPIAERAIELGIGGDASAETPNLGSVRTPVDGSLIVDLGDDFAPISLITPFGRLNILTASKLGNDEAWKQLKDFVAETMGLVPANLPEGVEGEHGRFFAAVTDFDGGRFSFPDEVTATDKVSTDKMQAKWNALHPARRDVFRIRPK